MRRRLVALALVAVSVVRGVGFAIVVVAVGALAAAVIPAERRGEGLGLLGLMATLPAVLTLPLGVWLVGQCGYGVAFAAAGVKFAILGKEETCSGDPARRAGNEYLYQVLAQTNIERLQQYQDRRKRCRGNDPDSRNVARRHPPEQRWKQAVSRRRHRYLTHQQRPAVERADR